MADILIVEDCVANLQTLSRALLGHGYSIRSAKTGQEALEVVAFCPPDLGLLDVGLPDIDGFEVCRRLKAKPEMQDVPIIFLTVRDEPCDKLVGFQIGGVDYITKPFDANELLARLAFHLNQAARVRQLEEENARLRQYEEQWEVVQEHMQAILHSLQGVAPSRWGRFGAIRIDAHSWQAWVGEEEVKLSRAEFLVLVRLVRAHGNVVTKQKLQAAAGASSEAAVCSTVRRLQAKIPGIQAVAGVGYRLVSDRKQA